MAGSRTLPPTHRNGIEGAAEARMGAKRTSGEARSEFSIRSTLRAGATFPPSHQKRGGRDEPGHDIVSVNVQKPARSLRRSGRHALVVQLLQALSGRGDVDVALRVGRDQMAAEHAGKVDGTDLVERLAVEDRDFLAGADIEELLIRV